MWVTSRQEDYHEGLWTTAVTFLRAHQGCPTIAQAFWCDCDRLLVQARWGPAPKICESLTDECSIIWRPHALQEQHGCKMPRCFIIHLLLPAVINICSSHLICCTSAMHHLTSHTAS